MKHVRPVRTLLAALAALAVAIAALAGCSARGSAASRAQDLSRTPLAARAGWQKYVPGAPGPYVWARSVSVVDGDGTVTDPDGLLARGRGTTTLSTVKDGWAGGVRIIVDLGELASGHVELGVRSASGAPVRMSYAEGRQFLGRWGDADTTPGSFFYRGQTLGTDDQPDGRADVFASPAHETVLRSPGLRGSQRYVAITLDGPGTLAIGFVRVRQTNLRETYDGNFVSSDPALNRIWYASAYGVDLSTVRGALANPGARWVIVDGPKRDRVAYAGDLQYVALSAYYQNPAYRAIVRDTIDLFACQQTSDGTLPAASRVDVPCSHAAAPDGPPAGFGPPGDAGLVREDGFSALWVVSVADYYRYTGDSATVRSLLPAANRVMRFFAAHSSSGLFVSGTYDGKPNYNWHSPDKAAGIDAYTNESYYGALRALASLERSVGGDAAAARALDDRAAQVRTALTARMWGQRTGAMVLNLGDPLANHTADANVGALLFGLLSPEQAARVMSFLGTTLATPYGTKTSQYANDPYMTQQISPYIMGEEELGMFSYGQGTAALRLLRSAWTHMMDTGPGTPWEQEAVDGTPGGAGTGTGGGTDLAHAWSSVIPVLSADVLGVQPVANGYRQWSVAPHPAGLAWAQGNIPVPQGTMSVRWKLGPDDGSFVLTVSAPRATAGSVSLPAFGADRTIAMDGAIVWRDGHALGGARAHRDGDSIVLTGVTGNHTFAWSR